MENGKKVSFADIKNDIKKSLSDNSEVRFGQLTVVFNDLREEIIKSDGECDEELLAFMLCKELELGYEDYQSLCVWSLLNSKKSSPL